MNGSGGRNELRVQNACAIGMLIVGLLTLGVTLLGPQVFNKAVSAIVLRWGASAAAVLFLLTVVLSMRQPIRCRRNRIRLDMSQAERVWLWLSELRCPKVEVLANDKWVVVRKSLWSRAGCCSRVSTAVLFPPWPQSEANAYAGVEICEPYDKGRYLIQLTVGRDGAALLKEHGEQTVAQLPTGTFDPSQWSTLNLRRRNDTYEAYVGRHRIATRPLQGGDSCIWPEAVGLRVRVGGAPGVTLEALFSRPKVS